MNDAVSGRHTWIIYILLNILVVLLTSYVIIISKVTRKTPSQQLRSVISAERKPSVTLFIVSADSIVTLLPWVITTLISVLSSGFSWIQFSPHGRISCTVLEFYYLNSILNPLIYAIRLQEFRRAVKGFFCRNNSSPARHDLWNFEQCRLIDCKYNLRWLNNAIVFNTLKKKRGFSHFEESLYLTTNWLRWTHENSTETLFFEDCNTVIHFE